jgi:hypothetical protein
MAEVPLEALGSQLEQLLRELGEIRKELGGIRTAQADLSSGQTALAQALLHIKRDGVIKDMLAHIDGQVRKLERKMEGRRNGSRRPTLRDGNRRPPGRVFRRPPDRSEKGQVRQGQSHRPGQTSPPCRGHKFYPSPPRRRT